MTNLLRQRTILSGFQGGPGVATMYFLDVATAIESVSRFWSSLTAILPNTVHITPERSGDTIEDTTGALTGSWLGGVVSTSVGQNPGAYSAPSGAVVTWRTSTVLDRKRVRGRTFVVPLAAGAYQDDGTLGAGAIGTIQAAATQLILEQSNSFVVWHRPFAGRAAVGTIPARPAHLGGHGLITASSVPDRAAVLRSRRD